MSRVAVENAIAVWVLAGSGLPPDRVIWSRQNRARLPSTKPYFELRITRTEKPGVDWRTHKDATVPTPGREIEYVIRGARVATLSMTCYASDGIGDASPDEIVDNVQMSVLDPDVAAGLQLAGVGVGRFDPIQFIEGVVNSTIIEPRATLTVSLHLAREKSAFGTYIETYELEPTITG